MHFRVPEPETAQDDPCGYEIFLPRRVSAGEVHRLRPVSPVAGWRYFPEAHGWPPCACPVCLLPGEYGARKVRERFGEPG